MRVFQFVWLNYGERDGQTERGREKEERDERELNRERDRGDMNRERERRCI